MSLPKTENIRKSSNTQIHEMRVRKGHYRFYGRR